MRLRQLFEAAPAQKVIAVMPGGFHPFHPGHKSLYDWSVETFGRENVYVAATNDTTTRPFPFDVKIKLAQMAGVPANRFIQVKSPFNALSYNDIIGDASQTALVFVRSEKDKTSHPLPDQVRKSDGNMGYLVSYKGNEDLETADTHGYLAYGPTIDFNFSGMSIKSASELRAAWPEMSDEDKLQAAELMYPGNGQTAAQLLDQALGSAPEPAESIAESKAMPDKIEPVVVPKFPPAPTQAGETDSGATVTQTKNGGLQLSNANGKFVYDKNGKPSRYSPAAVAQGFQLVTDIKTGVTTATYDQAGVKITGKYDKSGNKMQDAGSASYDVNMNEETPGVAQKITPLKMSSPPKAPDATIPRTRDGYTTDDGITYRQDKYDENIMHVETGSGDYTFDGARLIKWVTPRFKGVRQIHNFVQSTIKVDADIEIKTKDGPVMFSTDAVYDLEGNLKNAGKFSTSTAGLGFAFGNDEFNMDYVISDKLSIHVTGHPRKGKVSPEQVKTINNFIPKSEKDGLKQLINFANKVKEMGAKVTFKSPANQGAIPFNQGIKMLTQAKTDEGIAEDNNLNVIKSLVNPAAQQRMAQSRSAKRGGKEKALANLKNAHMFDDPIGMVKAALNMGATPEEVAQNLSPKANLSNAPTSDQIAQQRANDPYLQTNYSTEDVSPEDEDKFHNELDDLVHKYFGDSPDEREKMKKKYRVKESDLVLDKSRLRSHIISLIADKIAATDDIEQLSKWLKLIVGKELSPRGSRYQITSEDIVMALEASCKSRRKKKMRESGQDLSKAWKTYKQLKDFENQIAASKQTSNFTMSTGNSSKNLARDIANLEKQYPQFAGKYAKEIELYKKGAPQRLARMQTSIDNFKDD